WHDDRLRSPPRSRRRPIETAANPPALLFLQRSYKHALLLRHHARMLPSAVSGRRIRTMVVISASPFEKVGKGWQRPTLGLHRQATIEVIPERSEAASPESMHTGFSQFYNYSCFLFRGPCS